MKYFPRILQPPYMQSKIWVRQLLLNGVLLLVSYTLAIDSLANTRNGMEPPLKRARMDSNNQVGKETCYILLLKSMLKGKLVAKRYTDGERGPVNDRANKEMCSTSGVQKRKRLLQEPKTEIKIKKGAFLVIDQKAGYKEFPKIQNEKTSSEELSNSNEYETVELDLDKFVDIKDDNYKTLVTQLVIIFEQVANENNYNNGVIINKPYYATRKLEWKELETLLSAFLLACPTFNSWFRFLCCLPETLYALNGAKLNNIVEALHSKYWNFLAEVESAIENPTKVDKISFCETFKLFTGVFEKLQKERSKMKSETLCLLPIRLVELANKEDLASLIDSTERKKMKIWFLKWFVQSFPILKGNLTRKRNKADLEKKLLAYFRIISLFEPSEFYATLELEEFAFLHECFEYFLYSVLNFSDVTTVPQSLGVIDSLMDTGSIKALRTSEGFFRKHFMMDRKVWIHFGCNTIWRIQEQLEEKSLQVFWSVLRHYVVFRGGDGILITFEDETRENPRAGPNRSQLESFKIKNCAYWNLVDPNLKGKVVLSKAKRIELAFTNEKRTDLVLKIDGKDNILCPVLENNSEIVLFYKDSAMMNNEPNGLIKALPDYWVSESFSITDQSNTRFDAKKIDNVCAKMLELDTYKVSILFCASYEPNMHLKSVFYEYKVCSCLKNLTLNTFNDTRENVRFQICDGLKALHNKAKNNFQELSIEAAEDDFVWGYTDLLEVLWLTSLQYTYFCFEKLSESEVILARMAQNWFMMQNLRYFDVFPMLMLKSSVSQNLSQLFCLKKVSLVLPGENVPLQEDFDLLTNFIFKNLYLQEMELWIDPYTDSRFYKFVMSIRSKSLLRLSLLGRYETCVPILWKLLQKNPGDSLVLDRSLKSIHVSTSLFPYSFPYNTELTYVQKNQALLSEIFPPHIAHTLRPTWQLRFCGMCRQDHCEKKNPLISRLLLIN